MKAETKQLLIIGGIAAAFFYFRKQSGINGVKKISKTDLRTYVYPEGLLIVNKAKEINGDYETIAFINRDREIKLYKKQLPKNVINYINEQKNSNPNISASQKIPLFYN